MYMSTPIETQTEPAVDHESKLSFKLLKQNVDVPEHIDKTLSQFGWTHASYHPDTQEELFRKPPPDDCTDERRNKWPHDLQWGHWHWYEAMAYEFGKFITIEDESDKPSMNPNGASQAGATQQSK